MNVQHFGQFFKKVKGHFIILSKSTKIRLPEKHKSIVDHHHHPGIQPGHLAQNGQRKVAVPDLEKIQEGAGRPEEKVQSVSYIRQNLVSLRLDEKMIKKFCVLIGNCCFQKIRSNSQSILPTKKCKFCAEEMQKEAQKCRPCGNF